jgi:hypothetical protein
LDGALHLIFELHRFTLIQLPRESENSAKEWKRE